MAEYTKIGRIRPDYADTWDASRSYTALEMVKSADSYHAYIAKQDVPAGTPLTNADYWGEVLDVSDVIAESVAATNRANTAAANADAAREGIQDDLNGLHDELRTKADGILCTAEGETITLTDSSDDPMRGLVLFGKTTYDGTPSPENPVTLVNKGEKGSVEMTATGKNLLSFPNGMSEINGITQNNLGDEGVEIYGTATATTYINVALSLAAGDYVLSGAPAYASNPPYFCRVHGKIGENDVFFWDYGAAVNIHVTPDMQIDLYQIVINEGETIDATFYPMIRLASNPDTTYEPYKDGGSVTALTPNGLPGVPAAVDGNYTDADGQALVCDEVDFERGVYVKRIGERTLNGSENWNMNDGTNPENNDFVYYISAPDVGASIGLCDRLPYGMVADKDYVAATPNFGGVIYVRIKEYMAEDSLSAFKAALAQYPLTVIYPLATPIETPLTAEEIAAYRALHTNKPTTVIYNDEGAHMVVEYNADTKTYIDNKISELAAAIVNTNA